MTNKKFCAGLPVVSAEKIGSRYTLLKLSVAGAGVEMHPGQFVEVRAEGSQEAYLRRPISINMWDEERGEMWLLVAAVGPGTERICSAGPGDTLDCVFPLGNSFSVPQSGSRVLLVGGGVGVAPLLFHGKRLALAGCEPVFLLGAKTVGDIAEMDEFRRIGRVEVTTEDGSAGERGFVTGHSVLQEKFDMVCTCGPGPMMKAVDAYAHKAGIPCEASLENMMACGLGACLCCVEKTTEGNVCVCTEGPVFNTERLLWRQ